MVYFFMSFISHMGVCFTIFIIAVGGGVLIINMAPPFKDKKEFALIISLMAQLCLYPS